jgi:hypothetical protein
VREAVVRKGSMICGAAALLATVFPAQAQFYAPFGGPGMLTSPEAASGAIGAGAARSATQQEQCPQTATGRDGPRGLCVGGYPAPDPRR